MLFRIIHDIALMMHRERAGRKSGPSAGIPDSRTVKALIAGAVRGHDGAGKIGGYKRHTAEDSDGRLLMVNLTSTNVPNSVGTWMILDAIRRRWPWIGHPFADGARDRTRLMDKEAFLDSVIEVVRGPDNEPGSKAAPQHRSVECSFTRLTRWRRLT